MDDWGLILFVVAVAALSYSAGFGHRGVIERGMWQRDVEARELMRAKLRHPGYQEDWGKGGWDG